MSEIIPLTKKYSFLKKGIINMVLFFISIAGVTSIILHNVKVTGIETAVTLIVVAFSYFILFLFLLQFRHEVLMVAEPFEFILMSFISGMVAIFTLTNVCLVERILYLQEQDGQFSDVLLTFKDISDIKAVFKKRLLNIYRARIAYPARG